MKTLLLIDANSLIHRCFHALPPLTAPDGKPVHAIYGLSSVFLKLWREEKPDYAAALFDRPEPTFRKIEYKEYKAHRPKAPSELVQQIIEAHNFFEQFGVKTFESPGHEADDLIATLAEKFHTTKDLRVVVLTGDLDTLQLVQGNEVVIRTFRKGISDTFIYNEAAVRERYGLSPAQMPDYKALVGDPSDNIKGVPGVGPKTASEALKKFGTLEETYKRMNEEPKLARKLADFEAQAALAKRLVTLNRAVPLPVEELESLRVHDGRAIREYFERLGFDSLVRRLEDKGPETPRKMPKSTGKTGQGTMFSGSIVVESFAPDIDSKEPPAAVFIGEDIKAGAAGDEYASSKPKVGFGIKEFLKKLWVEEKDLAVPYVDLGVAFWLLDPDLKNYDPPFLMQRFLKKEWNGGADDLRALYGFALGKLEQYGLLGVFHDIEMSALRILGEIEATGIAINADALRVLEREIADKLAEYEVGIYREAGREFNINSPKQLGEIIGEKLSHETAPIKKTRTGQFATSAETLSLLKDRLPLAGLVLGYREGFKVLSTYVRPLLGLVAADGRVHTDFVQTGAATGRLSSREPNLQNIPQESIWASELRSAFQARDGFSFVAFDYSQVELRILAALSKDPALLKAFQNGADVHRATAAKIFGVPLNAVSPAMRRVAKTLNFGLIYGMGVSAFARAAGLSREDAGKFIAAYFKEFGRIRSWQEKVKSEAKTFGYVQTATGRRRYLLDIASGLPRAIAEAERAAVNQPIQGLAADIIKMAMIGCKRALIERGWWRRDVFMVLSIHDELLFEIRDSIIKEASTVIREAMEGAYALRVSLKAEISVGKDWGHLQKITAS